MAQNPATLGRKSVQLLRIVGLSSKPTLRFSFPTRIIPPNPPALLNHNHNLAAAFRSFSTRNYLQNSSGLSCFNQPGRSEIGFRQMGIDLIRVSAVADGGSGGGGGGGDSGGGGSGGGGEGWGGGERKWPPLAWYLTLLEKYPVLTKAVTAAVLTFVGDLTCQLAIDQVSFLDVKRIFIFTFLGMVLVGPTLHFWYLYLSKLVTLPGASGAFLRLIIDQFLFAPAFIGLFLSILVTLEGRPSQVIPKLQQEWFSSVLVNWQLWIPFQFLNFRFVPQQFQVLAANVISLVWNVILSYKAHKEVIVK